METADVFRLTPRERDAEFFRSTIQIASQNAEPARSPAACEGHILAEPLSMRRLYVLRTKADVVESHTPRTVGLDQARGLTADGMDCRRSNGDVS
ncbi:hypothetical protein GGD65_004071 [Bradyrhizobium sp. CIR18]|uniref:hypothetical protein n=1 Tax=Bradyrhizobium sp. CIR18 TaxID=2663839 RepID=UPI001849CAD5|nr:hypothetical protein [Bradyrhizobium sp. CIR18]MBB4363038.1 hypothetical protein [Bradyrhizobium sp. CIR18]